MGYRASSCNNDGEFSRRKCPELPVPEILHGLQVIVIILYLLLVYYCFEEQPDILQSLC
jgi:hypothetical protein